jgi:Putative metal-binding motif
MANGANVTIKITGPGLVTDNQGILIGCSNGDSGTHDCGTVHYPARTAVTLTAQPADATYWRFAGWQETGPDTIPCSGTGTCSFTSPVCVLCVVQFSLVATFDDLVDKDSDGYLAVSDCNDNDRGIHPNAIDIPHDGIDQNCDGHDNQDADGDGYSSGDVYHPYTGANPDCNDNNPDVHPHAVELPNDGIDENCDGPPDTSITASTPARDAISWLTSATFSFASSLRPGWDLLFECRLDGGAWTPCVSPRTFAGLRDGSHLFEVRGVDQDGLVDPTPARQTWTVDTTPPETGIVDGPPDGLLTNQTTARFAFSSEPGARFQCSLDGGPFAGCPNPDVLAGLPVGARSFRVRTLDAAGNVDPSPASRSWRITADLDGDGYPIGTEIGRDCNDNDPKIHPGARDRPGDGIDQNCDGHDARYPKVGALVSMSVLFFDTYTRVTSLVVSHVPKASTIDVRCNGRGCPFKSKSVRPRGSASHVQLERLLRRVELRRGAMIEVRVTERAHIGTVVRFTIRIGKNPIVRTRCLPPGAKKPGPC